MDQFKNKITSCCDSILSADWPTVLKDYGQAIHYVKGIEDKDPYTIGEDDVSHLGKNFTKGRDYNFEVPLFLGRVKQIDKDIHLKNSDKTVNERLELLFPNDGFVFLGAGRHSDVFIKRFPTPDIEVLKRTYPNLSALKAEFEEEGLLLDERYINLEQFLKNIWIKKHARKVIKFRKMDADGSSVDYEQKHIRKDLVLGGILEDCAKKFRYFDLDGHPYSRDLIRIAPYDAIKSKLNEIENGILTQEFIQGDSAFLIASHVKNALKNQDTKSESYLKTIGFKDTEDALHKLKAIQAFYYEIHLPIIAFEEKNDLPIAANYVISPKYVNGQNPLLPVGGDFGHGQNVTWEHSTKTWVIFDY
ncbi:MAG: hypothetical protein ABIQ95_02485 [Bdellovibrionia bacterium]